MNRLLPHFFFACFAPSLFLAIFFRSFGTFVAGILGVLPSFMGISDVSVSMVDQGKRVEPWGMVENFTASIFGFYLLVKFSR